MKLFPISLLIILVISETEQQLFHPWTIFYYESLNPRSIEFLSNQFSVAQQKLGSYIRFEVQPFGNTNFSIVNSKLSIECENGPVECLINRAHSCAQLEGINQDINQTLQLITCMYRDPNLTTNAVQIAKECFAKLPIEYERKQRYFDCVGEDEFLGGIAQAYSGIYTALANDTKITHFPWLMVNFRHLDGQFENDAFADFTGFLCKWILTDMNVPECSSNATKPARLSRKFSLKTAGANQFSSGISRELSRIESKIYWPSLQTILLYESLNQKSRDFVVKQFAVAQKQLGAYIHFGAIPFGNTNLTIINSELKIECENGQIECLTNRVQGCASATFMINETEPLQQITCIYNNSSPSTDPVQVAKNCLEKFPFPSDRKRYYLECIDEQQPLGRLVQAAVGIATAEALSNQLPGKVTTFPWLLLGKNHITGQNETDAFSNFTKYLCKAALSGRNVTECANYY